MTRKDTPHKNAHDIFKSVVLDCALKAVGTIGNYSK